MASLGNAPNGSGARHHAYWAGQGPASVHSGLPGMQDGVPPTSTGSTHSITSVSVISSADRTGAKPPPGPVLESTPWFLPGSGDPNVAFIMII